MPAEIKFSSFGIPYLVEFANISIRSPSTSFSKLKGKSKAVAKPVKLPPPPVRCATCGHLPHPPEKDVADDSLEKAPRPGGLYIRFGSQSDAAPSKISERRLAKLRWTIAEAVTQAGMSTPAAEETPNPMDSSDGRLTVRSTDSTKRALFKGTYGQVKEALVNAGLTTTPCAEAGFEHATRLGALFVVNSKGAGADKLELTKLTLWG